MPNQFDDIKFKKILLEVIDRLKPEKRFSFVAQFERLIGDLDYEQEDADKAFKIAYKYLEYLSREYNYEVFNIIYMTIEEGMKKKCHFGEWYDLYIKCLEREKIFYNKNFNKDKTPQMYWWPFYCNEDILILTHQKGGKHKFLNAFDIITQFPKELEIHDSHKVVSLMDEFPKTNKKIKTIVNRLFEKNPRKYYELRNKWLGK